SVRAVQQSLPTTCAWWKLRKLTFLQHIFETDYSKQRHLYSLYCLLQLNSIFERKVCMDRQTMLAAIKDRMPEKRYIHTIGVMETAIRLAHQYGENPEKAETAAIFHDIAKYADVDWMKQVVMEQRLDERLLDWNAEILHGPVGAWIVETEFQINDEAILNAIRYHTTG